MQCKSKIWDNVSHPIGVVQILSDNSERLISFLNHNGYIVIQSDDINFIFNITHRYNLPLFFITDHDTNNKLHKIITQQDIYKGAVSVADKSYNTFKRLFVKHAKSISNHIPLLIINIASTPYYTWGRLGQHLRDAYDIYDAKKLHILVCADIKPDSVFNCDYNIQYDILDFLTEIQNQK